MPRVTGVYCIRNKVNNKVYVGSSAGRGGIHGRWAEHKRDLRNKTHDNIHLQRAWDQYGEEAFEFFVVEECSPEDCLALEQYYIDLYDTTKRDKGYNICPNAGSSLGTKHSEEARANMSAAQRGKKKTAQHVARILAGNRANSPQAKAKKAAKLRGRKQSPEHLAKLTTIRRTPEHRAKISAKIKEARAQMRHKRFIERLEQ